MTAFIILSVYLGLIVGLLALMILGWGTIFLALYALYDFITLWYKTK